MLAPCPLDEEFAERLREHLASTTDHRETTEPGTSR